MKRIIQSMVGLAVLSIFACGPGPDPTQSTGPPSSGVQIIASPDNTAFVAVTNGTIPSYVNANNPTMSAVSQLPSGFIIDNTIGDINVTKGGIAYTFNLNGTSGFSTTADNAITMTFPFDPMLIPIEYRTSELNVFVKIFNPRDNFLHNLHGTVNVSGSNGVVTIETKGLPNNLTAAVIYNSNIKAQTISVNALSPVALSPTELAATVLPPWPASMWCVVYNPKNPDLIAASQKRLNITGTPSPLQIDNVVNTYVTQAVGFIQNTYMNAGFRAPNLNHSEASCGGITARVPKYRLFLGTYPDVGSHYTFSFDPKMWGVLEIQASQIGDDPGNPKTGSVKGGVAHEMLHAIQDGYEILTYDSVLGYNEGTATLFDSVFDNWPLIKVRSFDPCETKMLSDPLTIGTVDKTVTPNEVTCNNYSNQDYFAYVGRQYNNSNLDYLSGLFQSLRGEIIVNFHPPDPQNQVLYEAMDTYFQTKFKTSLNTIYLDFVRQRALDHNPSSQFGRSGETTKGFAENLFDSHAITEVVIDPSTCGVTDGNGKISEVFPYSSSAIKIISNSTVPAGECVTVKAEITSTLSPLYEINSYSGISNTMYGSGIKSNESFSSFGELNNKEAVIILSNTDFSKNEEYEYLVTCEKCNYSIFPTSKYFFSSTGSSGTIDVNASNGCSWTAVSKDDWITVTSGGTGTDNGTVNYAVAANTGTSERIGSISIAGKTFTVTQAGTPPAAAVNISASSCSLTSGDPIFSIFSYDIEIHWSATGPVGDRLTFSSHIFATTSGVNCVSSGCGSWPFDPLTGYCTRGPGDPETNSGTWCFNASCTVRPCPYSGADVAVLDSHNYIIAIESTGNFMCN